jgi:hypothetical protein
VTSYEGLWLRAFALTVAVELAIAVPLLRGAEPSLGRRALAVVVANLASHPVVWFVLWRVIASPAARTPVAEAWAVASETVVFALVFPAMSRARALGVSAVANAASFLVGVALSRLVLTPG